MTQEQILEGNKLIAKFMGYSKCGINFYREKTTIGKGGWFKDPKYHSSFDWLMPVVKEIRKHWHDDNSEAHKVCSLLIVAPIEQVWCNVVDFITFYNKTKQP